VRKVRDWIVADPLVAERALMTWSKRPMRASKSLRLANDIVTPLTDEVVRTPAT
jgi:hypothetical protein